MLFARFLVASTAFTFGVAFLLNAQEPAPKPLPDEKKEVASTFRAQVIVDQRTDVKNPRNRTNKLHCFVCENDLNPTVIVFARTIPTEKDSTAGKVIIALNQVAQEDKAIADNFGAYAIFLALDKEFQEDDNRDVGGNAVKAFSAAVKAPAVPMAIAAKQSKMTESWNIDESDITVVFYHRLKEVERWKFEAGGMDDLKITAMSGFIKKFLKVDEKK